MKGQNDVTESIISLFGVPSSKHDRSPEPKKPLESNNVVDINVLKKKNQQLQKELDQRDKDIAALREQNSALMATLQVPTVERKDFDKMKEDLQFQLDIKNQSIETLAKEIEELQKKQHENEKTILRCQQALKDYTRAQSDTRTLAQEVRELEAENNDLKSQRLALSEAVTILSSRIEELTLLLSNESQTSLKPKGNTRTEQDQQQLNQTLKLRFPQLENEHVINCMVLQVVCLRIGHLDFFTRDVKNLDLIKKLISFLGFNCSGGFMYVTTSYICFDSFIQVSYFPILDITSINKVTLFPLLPTLEFRLKNGELKRYLGFVRRTEAMQLICTCAKNLQHNIQLYNLGKKIENPL